MRADKASLEREFQHPCDDRDMNYDSTIKVGFADDCESGRPWSG